MEHPRARPTPVVDEDEIDLGRLMAAVWAGKFLVTMAAVAGLCTGILYVMATPPTYQADALLQLEERAGRLALPEAMQGLVGNDPLSVTEIEILRSRSVLSQAVADLNLTWRAEPLRAPVFGHLLTRFDVPLPELDALSGYARTTEDIRLEHLEVPATWVGEPIDLTITGNDQFRIVTPDGGLYDGRIGETLALDSLDFVLRVESLTGAPGRRFVIEQISERAAVGEVRGALSVAERGRQSNVLEVRYTSHDRAQAQRVLDAVLQAYVSQNVARSAAEAESSLQFIETQLPEAERALSEAERALSDFQQQRQSVHPEVANEVLNRTRNLELARGSYTELLARAQELRVVRASNVGNVRVLDTAEVAGTPIAPRRSRILALSIILGVLAGLGLVFLRNWMRRGVQGAQDLEQLGLPVLATINYTALGEARSTRKSRTPILALTDPTDLTVEGIRSLRTGLHFGMLDARTRTLAITSSAPGAGKSFIAANLAVVTAQAGQSVCLVDADLRRGNLRRYFDVPRDALGLADVLAGNVSWEDALQEGPVPGLFFLPTGKFPPNPSELLMRETLRELTQALSERFELSILDCPPVLAVTDPVIVARSAGATIAVVRYGVTPTGEVAALQKAMEAAGVRMSGSILNAYDPRRQQAGYNYNYNYRYSYGARRR